ncbi:MAG: RNA methyltransferase [Bacteroidetes bacterium]|nr:RNA methyltransferase [Bacteroidota bacterium]
MKKLKGVELNRKTVDEFKSAEKTPFVIVLDSVRSLNNVGSVFRTADAFLLEAIYLCGITGTPPHREIHKTALGAEESIDWFYHKSPIEAVKRLKSVGYELIAIEQVDESISLENYIPGKGKKYAIIFGNEVNGISEEVLEYVPTCIELPQYGTKHSLNIAVSVGIVVWDLFSKIKFKA